MKGKVYINWKDQKIISNQKEYDDIFIYYILNTAAFLLYNYDENNRKDNFNNLKKSTKIDKRKTTLGKATAQYRQNICVSWENLLS